jgi:hypothetical protein
VEFVEIILRDWDDLWSAIQFTLVKFCSCASVLGDRHARTDMLHAAYLRIKMTIHCFVATLLCVNYDGEARSAMKDKKKIVIFKACIESKQS